MKNVFAILFALFIACGRLFAGTINEADAKNVALTFFKINASNVHDQTSLTANLKYKQVEDDGSVDFYVFDMAPVKGFVIVTGYDNIEPVIGYSTESYFRTGGSHTGFGDWMNEASVKIVSAQRMGIQADANLTTQWTAYKQGQNPGMQKAGTVGPLLATTWDQENDISTPPPYIYNLFCPYNSTDQQRAVTGCVATAMAQIMKYWNYPAQGTGSYSYNDATPAFSYNYGVQSANFGATTFQWANMPNVLTPTTTGAQDSAVDLLMYECGVAVAMDYGDDNQGGSGAWVLQSEAGAGKPCAQQAYVNYFGYNPTTLKGVKSSSYTASGWVTLITNELNANRVVQYQGTDPAAGGHTWVVDGYEPNNLFHMNWGWGGFDNGYFSLTNLSVSGYKFSSDNGALIGIQPNVVSSCGAPTSPTTSGITTSSATFSWAAASGATSYNIQYQVVGAGSWTTATSGTNSYTANSLVSGTNYQWQVQSVCSSGPSTFTTANTFATTGTSCGVPASLASASINDTSATLSWGSVSGASSYNLQWKASSASSWNTITGLTSTSYAITGLTVCTAYQFSVQAVCSSGSSSFGTAASFTTTGCAISYCASTATTSTYEYIKNIKLGSINNTSAAAGYTNYTNLSTNLVGGSSNTITLTPGFSGTSYAEYWTVYIDFNHNGVFTDAGETVVKVTGKTAQSKAFTIPTTALNGPTRMRIQMQYGAYQTNPCATYTYGGVQDFTVNITGNAHIDLQQAEANTDLNTIRLYPNPAQNNLTIQFASDNDGVARMNIYNLTGQRVMNQEKASFAGVNIQDINTATLSNGVYIFEIENNGIIQRQKFIIAK